jgi:hypothetical protein
MREQSPISIAMAVALTCHALRTRPESFDVYDGGVLLWELVVGEAHGGNVVERRLPSDERDDCPAVIDDIVALATARDPIARFRSREEMAWTLQRAIAHFAVDVAEGALLSSGVSQGFVTSA